MSWRPEIDELKRRRELAREMGGPDKVECQHDFGKLTVRERIDAMIDTGSFHEIGEIAGRAEYTEDGELASFRPSNFVFGVGELRTWEVVVRHLAVAPSVSLALGSGAGIGAARVCTAHSHLDRIKERLNRVRSPFRSAEYFEIEEIIDPRDTRPILCRWANLVAESVPVGRQAFTYRP